ncbi:unnamed protein product [Allacma fusca]|uniref:RRM domain-containing protein n=1 Tax=Allacma fusca TaxID=39272 RepID=A0A8J2JTN6_9HEXA|nr:unnamed protein product [Allacma fusca]
MPRDRDDRGRSSRGGPPRGSDNRRFGPPSRSEHRVIVENLSSRVSWQDLKDYMRQAGEVTFADAHKQRRNEGVVEFATYSDMKAAIDKLDDTDLNGSRIRLTEDRGRGRGGGGGQSLALAVVPVVVTHGPDPSRGLNKADIQSLRTPENIPSSHSRG